MNDRKITVLTDSACDMPYDLEKTSGVDILNFSITVDGRCYTEREDFNFDEYYEILRRCDGIPATAQITQLRFLDKFKGYDDDGCGQLLYVSICAAGSATHDAAVMAERQFRKERPGSPMRIFIVDSHCYSMAYGYYVAQAAEKLADGAAMEDVAAWLEDIFSRVEILLAAFSLRFMKKSGRISAAAAVAGEVLGIRPIITLNDGISTVQKKIRGDKDVLPAMVEYLKQHHAPPLEYQVGGTGDDTIAALAKLAGETFGRPPVFTFKLGAAVATNTGPDAIAFTYLGPRRPH
jgi:DegV family protein with EDD domain